MAARWERLHTLSLQHHSASFFTSCASNPGVICTESHNSAHADPRSRSYTRASRAKRRTNQQAHLLPQNPIRTIRRISSPSRVPPQGGVLAVTPSAPTTSPSHQRAVERSNGACASLAQERKSLTTADPLRATTRQRQRQRPRVSVPWRCEQIVPKRLHKGVVVSTILRTQRERCGSNPDFVFCVGDDASDEQMFSAVYSFLAQAEEHAG